MVDGDGGSKFLFSINSLYFLFPIFLPLFSYRIPLEKQRLVNGGYLMKTFITVGFIFIYIIGLFSFDYIISTDNLERWTELEAPIIKGRVVSFHLLSFLFL